MADVLQLLMLSGVGSVHAIVGPMFSGKTEELIRRIRTAAIAGLKCCLIRPQLDDRWAEEEERDGFALKTHEGGGLKRSELLAVVRCKTLDEVIKNEALYADCKIIAIDEGQFIPDLNQGCQVFASMGKVVHVSALNGDKDQKPWDCVSALRANVESEQMLLAVCAECNLRPAPFTIRARGSAKESAREDPGGKDKYTVVCRACKAL